MKIEDKEKFFCKTISNAFLLFFIAFITLYISYKTGYYEIGERKKVTLTEEKIKQFEEDIANGKNIDIKDYVGDTKKNYNNNTSRFGLFLSKKIGEYAEASIENTFKFLDKMFQE